MRRAWFPVRRCARFLKRSAKALAGWAIAVPFLCIAYLVYLFFDPLTMLGPDGIASELLSIGLGSCVLLYMKERVDFETRRRRTLEFQYRFYCDKAWKIYRLFSHLAHLEGFKVVDYSDFYTSNGCGGVLIPGVMPMPTEPFDSAEKELRSIRSEINAIRETCYLQQLIDCDAGELSTAVSGALDAIARLEPKDDNSKQDIELLGSYLVSIICMLRRPWHYSNDEAHKQLLRKFLDVRAVELKDCIW